MGFHWNKDQVSNRNRISNEYTWLTLRQLLARRGETESTGEEAEKWTSFEMPLREAGPIPVAFDFTRFLASSITFMTTSSICPLFIR